MGTLNFLECRKFELPKTLLNHILKDTWVQRDTVRDGRCILLNNSSFEYLYFIQL